MTYRLPKNSWSGYVHEVAFQYLYSGIMQGWQPAKAVLRSMEDAIRQKSHKKDHEHSCIVEFAEILRRMEESGYLIDCAPKVLHSQYCHEKIALRFGNFTLGITGQFFLHVLCKL